MKKYLTFISVAVLVFSSGICASADEAPAEIPAAGIDSTQAPSQEEQAAQALAQETQREKRLAAETKLLAGIEFFAGYGWGNMRGQKTMRQYPLIVDFDFDLKPLVQKLNISFPLLLQFQIEPFASFINRPKNNIETGVAFFLKIGLLPDTWKLQPYIKGGVGLDYMSLHTKEQGSQFNFIEPGGAGIHYFFNKDTALTIEGRFRHLSNAGISDPNSGINTYFGLVGISKKF